MSPFVDPLDRLNQPGRNRLPKIAETEEPEFFRDLIPAAFRRENTIGSFLANEVTAERGVQNPDFDPFADLDGSPYEDWAESFIEADTPEEVSSIKRQIDQEQENIRTLQAGGGMGLLAGFLGAVVDPIMFVPVGGALVKGKQAGSLLRGALATARAGMIGETITEAALHSSQIDRTFQESALNVTAATLLSGAMGTGFAALTRGQARRAVADVERMMDLQNKIGGGSDEPVTLSKEVLEAGTGPKGNPNATQEALESEWAGKATGFLSPASRVGARSKSVEARGLMQRMIPLPWTYAKNALNIASPVNLWSKIQRWNAPLYSNIELGRKLFVLHRTGKEGGALARARIRAGDLVKKPDASKLQLTWKEFNEAAGKAMRTGDAGGIKHVTELARAWRKNTYDPLLEKAIRLKRLPEGVTTETAMSYFNRVWNQRILNAKKPEFIKITRIWLEVEHPEMSVENLAEVADQIHRRLTGLEAGRVLTEPVKISGIPALKQRTFTISDQSIEQFLESDIELVGRIYSKTMATELEMFEEFGSITMEEEIKKVTKSWDRILAEEPTEKGKLKLVAERDQDLQDIADVRDMIRGTFDATGNPEALGTRFRDGVLSYNFIAIGGGFAPSSIADMGNVVMANGITRTVGSAFRILANPKAFKLTRAENKLAAVGYEMVSNGRAQAWADIGDPYRGGTKPGRGLRAVGDSFSLANLLSPYNNAAKHFAGITTQSRILDGVLGRAKPKEITRLRASGISDKMAGRIGEQFKEHGETLSGLKIAHTSKWTDFEARDLFRIALRQDVDIQIVTPIPGIRPTWMSRGWGKVVGQFRSFSFASTQMLTLPRFQQRDISVLQGLLVSVGLGSMIYAHKTLQAGRPLSEDWRVWLKEAIDRSGVLGFLMDVNNIAEKGSRGTVGISAALGGPTSSRYASRTLAGAIFGPAVGLVTRAGGVSGSIFTGEFTANDVKNMRRMLPFQNLFYLSWLFDKAEAAINEEFNIPERRRK